MTQVPGQWWLSSQAEGGEDRVEELLDDLLLLGEPGAAADGDGLDRLDARDGADAGLVRVRVGVGVGVRVGVRVRVRVTSIPAPTRTTSVPTVMEKTARTSRPKKVRPG